MHSIARLIFSFFILLLLCSCSEDRIVKNEPPSPYKNLKEKDDILFNLELAYEERNIDEYIKLLDMEAIFIFSPQDYASGKTPRQLNREEDIIATRHLFGLTDQTYLNDILFLHRSSDMALSSHGTSSFGSIKASYLDSTNTLVESLALDLSYAEGDIAWEEAAPPPEHTNEDWYQKFVTYDFSIHLSDGQSFYAIDSQALFVIRYAFNEAAGDTIWQITRWFDLGPLE